MSYLLNNTCKLCDSKLLLINNNTNNTNNDIIKKYHCPIHKYFLNKINVRIYDEGFYFDMKDNDIISYSSILHSPFNNNKQMIDLFYNKSLIHFLPSNIPFTFEDHYSLFLKIKNTQILK